MDAKHEKPVCAVCDQPIKAKPVEAANGDPVHKQCRREANRGTRWLTGFFAPPDREVRRVWWATGEGRS